MSKLLIWAIGTFQSLLGPSADFGLDTSPIYPASPTSRLTDSPSDDFTQFSFWLSKSLLNVHKTTKQSSASD